MNPRRFVFAALLLALFLPALSACAQDEPPQENADQQQPRRARTLPLKATDKIEFTTDEGTWMSVDISHDGKLIVFDLLGDLYTVPAAGGEAKRIVGGISFESQPRFSPDGKRIVFISDRDGAENLWTADADGTNLKQVSRGQNHAFLSPSWTPER